MKCAEQRFPQAVQKTNPEEAINKNNITLYFCFGYTYITNDPTHSMKKESFRYAALVFFIMGLTGIFSETGPIWARYTLLSAGILIFLVTYFKRQKN